MPGEMFGEGHAKLLVHYTELWESYPGFEGEIHGVVQRGNQYLIACVKLPPPDLIEPGAV